MSENDPKKKRSLSDEEVIIERPMGRRSSMAMLGGAILGAAGLVAVGTPQRAEAQCTDSDSGPNADRAGSGRGNGVSDSDPNDPGGCGRGRRTSGITDRDPSDPGGNGRGRRSCSDSDPNDPGGRGRHC